MRSRGDVSGALTAVEPAFLHVPPYDYTDGDQVAGLCDEAHFGPDPEQRLCLDAMFARNQAGKSVAYETVLVGARQNFKTAVEMQASLGWLFLFKADPVVWTGQEWDVIGRHFHQIDLIISGYSWLSRQVRYVHRGERDQEIGLKSGATLLFKTRTPDGGAGLTGEKVVLDEGWKVTPEHISGLLPTLSARSITGDPQVVYGSSAAHTESSVLRDLVSRGRAAATDPRVGEAESRLVLVEFCAPPPAVACRLGDRCDHGRSTPGCGCDNPEYWRMGNPAMGRRISREHIAIERRSWPPAVFGRERMGWHDPGEGEDDMSLLADWATSADAGSEPRSRVGLAVAFTSKRDRAAIGLVGRRSDGRLHVEVANYQAGTNWVVPWITRRCYDPEFADSPHYPPVIVAVDRNGHEKTVIGPLREAGIEVMELDYQDVTSAYAEFVDALTDRHDLVHRDLGDDGEADELTTELFSASTRDVGDAGKAWGRRKSRDGRHGAEIAALVAVTNALHGFLEHEPDDETDEPGVWVM